MKVTTKGRIDFNFFANTALDMIGVEVGASSVVYSQEGYSAEECFFAMDSRGETLPCREPELLKKAIRGKKSWNLQVKLWAEDLADGMLLQQRELLDYCESVPRWILDATFSQARKRLMATVGYTPRFATLVRFSGSVWFPDMDCFDWSI